VESQANALAEIFWLAHSLHQREGTHVQELGSRLPEGVEVRVVEESAQTIYLVLPSASALGEGGEISDQELEAAAGGGGEERDPSCYKTACGW
jgi:hypothetical protein